MRRCIVIVTPDLTKREEFEVVFSGLRGPEAEKAVAAGKGDCVELIDLGQHSARRFPNGEKADAARAKSRKAEQAAAAAKEAETKAEASKAAAAEAEKTASEAKKLAAAEAKAAKASTTPATDKK